MRMVGVELHAEHGGEGDEASDEGVDEERADADEQAAFDKSCASVQELIDASRKLVG